MVTLHHNFLPPTSTSVQLFSIAKSTVKSSNAFSYGITIYIDNTRCRFLVRGRKHRSHCSANSIFGPHRRASTQLFRILRPLHDSNPPKRRENRWLSGSTFIGLRARRAMLSASFVRREKFPTRRQAAHVLRGRGAHSHEPQIPDRRSSA